MNPFHAGSVVSGRRRRGSAVVARRGFTLIEMLVVLLVMGLLAGLVTAAATPDDRTLLRSEADRLAQLLDLAATEARFTGQAVAWTANGPAYRFWRFSEAAGWLPIEDQALRPRTLPPGIVVTRLQVDNTRSPERMRLQFNPNGAAASFRVELALGEARCAVAGSPLGEFSVLPQ